MMKSGKQKKTEIRKKRLEKREQAMPKERITGPVYHIPENWTFLKLRERYLELAGRLEVENPLEIYFDQDIHESIYHRNLLDSILNGLRNGDPACIELSVQFVSTQVYFFWSGYTRAAMARRLKSTDLSTNQKETIRVGIYEIFKTENYGQEIKELIRLLKKIGLGKHEKKFRDLPENFCTRAIFKQT